MRIMCQWLMAVTGAVFWLNGLDGAGLRAAEYKVDKSKSKVTVDVKATGDDFTARLVDYRADIAIDDATRQPVKAVFSWDFKDLKTGKDKRDQVMLEWMGVPKYSRATFAFEKWETKKEGVYATGVMDLHGVKKILSFPVTVEEAGGEMTMRGQAQMDHRDHGLKIIRMMLLFKVDPKLVVDFELKGELVP